MEELAALEHELMRAVSAREMARVRELLAPEFTLTTGRPGHEVRDRAEYLDVTATDYEIDSFSFDELVVEPYGDAAVVRSRFAQAGRMGGADRTGSFLLTDVWIRRDGTWRLVARHSTAVQP